MATFDIKEDDTKRYLQVTITIGGTALDLSGTTVTFTMKNVIADSTPKVDAQSCDITDATAGQCEYRWAAGDTDTIGTYHGEFIVTYGDATVLTTPQDSYITIKIRSKLST